MPIMHVSRTVCIFPDIMHDHWLSSSYYVTASAHACGKLLDKL